MLERWQLYRLDREYRQLCELFAHERIQSSLAAEPHLSEAASLLALSQVDVCLNEDSFDIMTDRLAAVREHYGVSPEDMQAALQSNEAILGED